VRFSCARFTSHPVKPPCFVVAGKMPHRLAPSRSVVSAYILVRQRPSQHD
jgi:hypothetical protein